MGHVVLPWRSPGPGHCVATTSGSIGVGHAQELWTDSEDSSSEVDTIISVRTLLCLVRNGSKLFIQQTLLLSVCVRVCVCVCGSWPKSPSREKIKLSAISFSTAAPCLILPNANSSFVANQRTPEKPCQLALFSRALLCVSERTSD